MKSSYRRIICAMCPLTKMTYVLHETFILLKQSTFFIILKSCK